MGNNLIFTSTRHILPGKHVIEIAHRSRFSDTCRWTLGSMQSQCFSIRRKSPKTAPYHVGIRTPHGDCGSPHPTCQMASRSVRPFLQNTCPLHDRPTTPHVSSNRPHLYATHIWRGLITFIKNNDTMKYDIIMCIIWKTYVMTLPVKILVVCLVLTTRRGNSELFAYIDQFRQPLITAWTAQTQQLLFLLLTIYDILFIKLYSANITTPWKTANHAILLRKKHITLKQIVNTT